MGSSLSIYDKAGTQMKVVEAAVDSKLQKQAMLQREIQMSVTIAQARDKLMWYGSLYSLYLFGISAAILSKRAHKLPAVAPMPGIIGGFGLLNLYDVAYGGKLARVTKEAEYIMEHERSRLLPMKQAPFFKLYSDDEKSHFPYSTSDAVGSYWPSFLHMSRRCPPSRDE